MLFFCCLCGCVSFFWLFGRGPRPRPNSKKKKTRTRPNSKKKHAPAPSERVFFCCLGGSVCLFLCCLGGWRFFFFLGVFFFWLFGRGRVPFFFFCCLGGDVFFFCCLGRGRVFFAVWAGDGSSLTYPSAWLVFKRSNDRRDRTAKKNTGSSYEALVFALLQVRTPHFLGVYGEP